MCCGIVARCRRGPAKKPACSRLRYHLVEVHVGHCDPKDGQTNYGSTTAITNASILAVWERQGGSLLAAVCGAYGRAASMTRHPEINAVFRRCALLRGGGFAELNGSGNDFSGPLTGMENSQRRALGGQNFGPVAHDAVLAHEADVARRSQSAVSCSGLEGRRRGVPNPTLCHWPGTEPSPCHRCRWRWSAGWRLPGSGIR